MLKQYLENIITYYNEDANATTFYHEILTAIFLAYPDVRVKKVDDPIINNIETKLEKLNNKVGNLTPNQAVEKERLEKELEDYIKLHKPPQTKSDRLIEYPSDIYRFINHGGGDEKVFIIADASLSPISLLDLKQDRFVNVDLDEQNSKDMFSVASDAMYTANAIRNNIKFKKLDRVYWTGPTNDSVPQFGAGDIVAVDKTSDGEIFHSISLKFGEGQFKNLSAGTVAGLLGILDDESDDSFAKQLYNEFTEDWTEMTKEWYAQLISWAAKYKLKHIQSIVKTYSSITNYQEYQKIKLTQGEMDLFSADLVELTNDKNLLNLGRKSQNLRYFCRKFYQFLDRATTKSWGNDDEDSTGTRTKYFEQIIGGFFGFGSNPKAKKRRKVIDENLGNLFIRQVSALPNTELWYAAETGKVFTAIPSQKTIRKALKDGKLTLRCDASSSGSGYVLPLIVSIGKEDVFWIKIMFRWAQGQMDGLFTTTSSKKTEYSDWGQLLKGIIPKQ